MTVAQSLSYARRRMNAYTAALMMALASFVFLTTVPFLPGSPILPLLASVALAVSSLKRPSWASGVLYALAFLSILWQLSGFGLPQFFQTSVGAIVASIIIIALGANTISARLEPTSTALALLAVALMLTPQYYLSVAIIAAAAAMYDLSSIGPLSSTFIATILPLLFMENAIYYASLPKGTEAVPIIFSQLTHLAINLRPPLPGLNIFLTGLPPDFASSYTAQIVRFMSSSVSVMIVPIFLFGLVFSSSASMAGIVNSALDRLSVFERTSRILRIISPLVASIVTSVAFAALITLLSSRGIGGYETSLNNNPLDAIYMVLGSAFLGALFTGREFFIQRVERIETARAQLLQLLEKAKVGVQNARKIADKVAKGAPTVELAEESKALDEHSSYVVDIERGVETASYASLTRWISDLEQRLLPFIENVPERLRLKTIKELNTMSSLVSTFGATIQESGVQAVFPELGTISLDMSIDDALQIYGEAVRDIRETATKLYETYVSAINSYNILRDHEVTPPPVNPAYLFDSYDYVTGMKLLAEEYWLSFHVSASQELESAMKSLSKGLAQLEEICDQESCIRMEQVLNSIVRGKPADSTFILQKVKELMTLLGNVINNAVVEAEQLEKMIAQFATSASFVHFEAVGQSNRLVALKDELGFLKPAFRNLTEFIETAASVLADQAERKNKDEQNLIMLSHYFMARKVIEHLLENSSMLRIQELPFQHDAAIFFARLYSLRNRSVEYDDGNEILVVTHARMGK